MRTATSAGRHASLRQYPHRGATRLSCPLLSLHQCSTRRRSPQLSHRPSWEPGGRMMRTGRPTISRCPRRRPSPPPRLPKRRALRSNLRRTLPTTLRLPAPSQDVQRQVARRLRPAPQHPFPSPTYTDDFPMRESGSVALPRAAGEYTKQEPKGAFRPLPLPTNLGGLDSLRERGRTRSNNTTFFLCTVTDPSPHLQTEKNTTSTPDLRCHMMMMN